MADKVEYKEVVVSPPGSFTATDLKKVAWETFVVGCVAMCAYLTSTVIPSLQPDGDGTKLFLLTAAVAAVKAISAWLSNTVRLN